MIKSLEAKARKAARAKARYKECPEHKEKMRRKCQAYYSANRERIIARQKVYNDTHPEVRKTYTRSPARLEKQRDAHLKRKYGVSLAEIKALLNNQGGVCAICGKAEWNGREPYVDHSHATGKIRGILCCNCNLALGLIGEDPKTARAIADYLESKRNG